MRSEYRIVALELEAELSNVLNLLAAVPFMGRCSIFTHMFSVDKDYSLDCRRIGMSGTRGNFFLVVTYFRCWIFCLFLSLFDRINVEAMKKYMNYIAGV